MAYNVLRISRIWLDLDVAIQRLNGEPSAHPAAIQLTGVYHNLLRQWRTFEAAMALFRRA